LFHLVIFSYFKPTTTMAAEGRKHYDACASLDESAREGEESSK
jgi:hypothetical protein